MKNHLLIVFSFFLLFPFDAVNADKKICNFFYQYYLEKTPEVEFENEEDDSFGTRKIISVTEDSDLINTSVSVLKKQYRQFSIPTNKSINTFEEEIIEGNDRYILCAFDEKTDKYISRGSGIHYKLNSDQSAFDIEYQSTLGNSYDNIKLFVLMITKEELSRHQGASLNEAHLRTSPLNMSLMSTAEVRANEPWDYVILQRDKPVINKLLPYENVMLKVAEDVEFKVHVSSLSPKEIDPYSNLVSSYSEYDYQVYNLGDFDPDAIVDISLMRKGASEKKHDKPVMLPRKRLFVRPGPISLRYSKAVVNNLDRAPDFLAVFVRVARSETVVPLNSNSATWAIGANVGVSIDGGQRVYYAGTGLELYDSVAVIVGAAYYTIENSEGYNEFKPDLLVGLSADLRLAAKFISGIADYMTGR